MWGPVLIEIILSPIILTFYAIRAIRATRAKKYHENFVSSPIMRTIPTTR